MSQPECKRLKSVTLDSPSVGESSSKCFHDGIAHPLSLYGIVKTYERKMTEENSSIREAVVVVEQIQKDDPSSTTVTSEHTTTFTVILRDAWSSTVLHIEDPVNVVILSGYSNPTYIISESNANFIVVYPNMLLTATTIAGSFHCIRRAVLSSFISSTQDSIYSLLGQMRHKLFEYGSSLEVPQDSRFIVPKLIQSLHQYVVSLIKESIQSIYEIRVSLSKIYEELHASIPGVIEWITRRPNDSIPIYKIGRNEDSIWCPCLGLKGVIDITCEVKSNGKLRTIPIELKTGKEDPISHTAQISLYSIMLPYVLNEDVSHLSSQQLVSGVLIYLKSDPLSVTISESQAQEEILLEMDKNSKGPYIIRILSEVKSRAVLVMDRKQSYLTFRSKMISLPQLSHILLRRNLIATMITRMKSEFSLKKDKDIEDLGTVMDRIDGSYQTLSLPDGCSSILCEKCPSFSFCSILTQSKASKTDVSETSDCSSSKQKQKLPDSFIRYFKKWMSLLQIERAENDKNDPNKSIWRQSTQKRVNTGLCINDVLLVKQERIALSDNWTLFFKCKTDVSFNGFEVGDMVLVSTITGGWGKALGKVESLSDPSNSSEKHSTILYDDCFMVVLSAPTSLSINEHYRIDHYRSYDISTVLVNTIVSFLTLNRYSRKSDDDAYVNHESLSRFQEIVIDGKQPRMSHKYDSIEQILSSIEDQRILEMYNGDRWNENDDLLFSHVIDMVSGCNCEQKDAIIMCFNSDDLSILKGLPGTGKTTVITIITLLCVLLRKRILITSHTHTAIDNVLMKLVSYNIPILRLGDLMKVNPAVRQYHISQQWDGRFDSYQRLMDSSAVIGATVFTNISQFPHNCNFDLCIVDECGQITEPSILQVFLLSKRVLLVGDSKQLPPVVRSSIAAKCGLDFSLLARLEQNATPNSEWTRDLTLQYRMNHSIMELVNHLIYDNSLQAGSTQIRDAVLHVDLSEDTPLWMHEVFDTPCGVVFMNTDKLDDNQQLQKKQEERNGSLENSFEARLISILIDSLINGNVSKESIGVISPYNAQVKCITDHISGKEVEVSTVDRFQGRDKDCIIVSLVRSNSEQQIGTLLKDWRRVNVAFSRARKKLIIIGSEKTLEMEPIWMKCIRYCHENCCVVHVQNDLG